MTKTGFATKRNSVQVHQGRSSMPCRISGGAIALTVLMMTLASAEAFDDATYPNLKGQWTRISPPGMPAFDPNKPRGRGQEAPYTPEYQAVFEANLRDIAEGGEGAWPGYTCRPPGMPAMMTAYEAMEIVITPA